MGKKKKNAHALSRSRAELEECVCVARLLFEDPQAMADVQDYQQNMGPPGKYSSLQA